MGMMRFKSEEDFKEFQKRTGIRETKQYRPPAPNQDKCLIEAAPITEKAWASLKPKAPPGPSQIHIRMRQQIQQAGLPEPIEEYYHIKGRDFRLDFAWPDRKIGLEVQGMAHRIKGKFHADIEKRALALIDGWRILEVSGNAVRDERGIGWLKQLMAE